MRLIRKLAVTVLVFFTITSCSPSKCNEYASHLVELAGNASGLAYQLSPDGRWFVSDTCFSWGEDIIVIDTLNQGNRIRVDTKKYLPETYRTLCGMFWSPDSRSFIALGAIMPPQNAFIVIFDIADPSDIKKFVFEWKYDSYAGVEWSPDSSKLLVFTERDRQSFVVDRHGALLADFKLPSDISSGTWIDGSNYAVIKDNRDLWVMQLEQGTEKKIYTFVNDMQILGYHPGKNVLLLLSDTTNDLEFIVFDISKVKETSSYRTDKPAFEYYRSYSFISAPNSDFSGITAHSTLWLFDWKTFKAKNYGDGIGPVIWSPVCEKFLVMKNHNDKELVPLVP